MTKFNFLTLTVDALATFRLALMLSSDVGPFAVFTKLRSFLKREAKESKPLRASKIHEGIECSRCSSVWCAIPIATYAYCRRFLADWFCAAVDVLLVALALSAIAVLLNRIPKR